MKCLSNDTSVLLFLTLSSGLFCLSGDDRLAHGAAAERADAEPQSSTAPVALIDDTSFERGLVVWSPQPGKKVRAGRLQPFPDQGPPVWNLAQWSSHFDLSQAARQVVAPRLIRYSDGAKSIVFDFRSPDEPVVTLGLDGITEYERKSPKLGAPWPHLLVEREFISHPRISDLDSIGFRISYRLIRQEVLRPPGWNARRHTAQFLLYITLRNQNRKSAGLGDYLWFGVPMYDARYRHMPGHKAADLGTQHKGGTGKYIFNPAGDRYTSQSAHDGEWITIEHDLLPLMKEAIRDAWNKGFLPDSHELSDYGLGGMNCGWEVTGTWNVAMQIKGLKLEANDSARSSKGNR